MKKVSSNKIKLAGDNISRGDINSLVKWLGKDPIPRLTKGELTIEFEKRFAELIGTKYSVMVNSGSSALLLSVYSLIVENNLKNKKICVPALSWATDLAPLIQFGITPLIIDCNLKDLSVDLLDLERVFIREKPDALILVSVLGLSPDMKAVIELCNKHGVILIEDVCESTGSMFGQHFLGSFGHLSCHSLYMGHNFCTVEGGMICTNNENTYHILLMLRSHGWSRDLPKDKKEYLRLEYNINEFDELYTFYVPGFNLRSTDLQAHIGLNQLKRFKEISSKRNENYESYNRLLKNDYWKAESYGFVCNLGYPVVHPNKELIVSALKNKNVEVRPLIAGSMGKQPVYVQRYGLLELPNVRTVDDYGFYVPNHPELSHEDIEYVCGIINIEINKEITVTAV